MNFTCPYCSTRATVDLAEEDQHAFGLVVCNGCAGYVRRQDGEWHPLNYDGIDRVARRVPVLFAQLEIQRIKILEPWVGEEALAPTLFGAVTAALVRERGWDIVRWRPRDEPS